MGTWDDEKQCYNGGRLKGVQVPSKLAYVALRKFEHKVIDVNGSESNIVLRVKYNLDFDSFVVVIEDGDDVQFFLMNMHTVDHNYV